jgi:hypothetical protein
MKHHTNLINVAVDPHQDRLYRLMGIIDHRKLSTTCHTLVGRLPIGIRFIMVLPVVSCKQGTHILHHMPMRPSRRDRRDHHMAIRLMGHILLLDILQVHHRIVRWIGGNPLGIVLGTYRPNRLQL